MSLLSDRAGPILAAVIALAGSAGATLAQQPAPPRPAAPAAAPVSAAFARVPETDRHAAANTAATRAVNLCSGLWSGNQTQAQIEGDLINPGGRPAGTEMATNIDRVKKTVSVAYAEGLPPRIVVWRPVMGCVQLPVGATMADARFVPQVPASVRTPDLDGQPWPMGDKDAVGALPPAKQAAIDRLVTAAFDGKTYGGVTWGVVIVADGKIVGERYKVGYDLHTGSQTHSAAKSFAGTLVGIAVKKYGYDIKKPGALKAWRKPGDPRGQITPEHLLHMSSGLYGEGAGSPQQDIYGQGGTVEGRAGSNILDTLPGTRFLYNPPDTMLLMRSVRETVNNDFAYWAMPWKELFWKIGMTRTVTSSDWNGDFLMSGQTWSTARDFARFGQFYLQDGVWNGERILPVGWAKYVATPSGPQPAGTGPRYGAQFWLYGGQSGLPADAFSPNGGQGHYAMIVPSRKVVVVRRGFDAGAGFQIAKFSADVLAALAN